MPILNWRRDEYLISTDRALIDIDCVHRFLCEQSYWAEGRPREVVERSIDNSLCFGVYRASPDHRQVGFARVVTDSVTFAWLCDVFVNDSERGAGLGKWLMQCVVSHPRLEHVVRFILATRDAHSLYRDYGGFEPLEDASKWMIRAAR